MCRECEICYYGDGGCLAGLRDDDFVMAEERQLIERLDTGKYASYHKKIKETLVKEYLYDYNKRRRIEI